ncbi:HNH endonuclease family protein [uncultured Methylobacterium sp.]|uniref:HNH endonuclease family protein n=1 Tax=uncultured Methylobacterium sp. TaxID=157278 RepID=UPI0035CBEAA4
MQARISEFAWGAEGMATNVVNLDAMIPREDMASPSGDIRAQNSEKISITDLDTGFFSAMLRKPDFQRETAHWTPDKVANLIKAFVKGDLIPALILWRRGANIFVIDGAHRLSALLAWIKDDYGVGRLSQEHFGSRIPEEQARIAAKTRDLVNAAVGPYALFSGARHNPRTASPEVLEIVGRLAANALVAQWVPQVEQSAAEESFFTINQAATPIDATEQQILRSRDRANAIASRAIVRGATGHKYWAAFPEATRIEIEEKARTIHEYLYAPPLSAPIKTLDVPIAGKGYSALPFVYELVNWSNNVPDPPKGKHSALEPDIDGSATLEYLRSVQRSVGLITGVDMRSLGLHPIVYFYTRGGEFQPAIFIAIADFARQLVKREKLVEFTRVRGRFEQFIITHKDFVTSIVKKTGGKDKSHPRLFRYFDKLIEELSLEKDEMGVLQALVNSDEFSFLLSTQPLAIDQEDSNPRRRFNRATKSAAFLDAALPTALKCAVCGGFVHVNSMQFDHKTEARNGGATDASNAQVTHPYCNSAKSILQGIKFAAAEASA